jgi:Protein of unknown function (DUF3024)
MDVDRCAVTILECRLPWREDFGPERTSLPVARLRYTKARKEWAIHWRDRHLRYHFYDTVEPTPSVESVLAEIDVDPTCIVWGLRTRARAVNRFGGSREPRRSPADNCRG